MAGYGYRLDTKPYLGGALETKILLEKLPLRKDPLHTLTKGFSGGIYNGPQFVRRYVESPESGVPFITGSSMQLADLSNLSLLSRRDAHGPKLRHLELQPGMSLISCSGTIGRMAYARADMKGVWSSQDVLKIVADPRKIPSGYLYAYLCSRFGIPLVVSGTYGAIIQHLEPEHIAGLPVPRLGDALEHEIHTLVEEAAGLRTKASGQFHAAIADFEHAAGLPSSARLCAAGNNSFVVVQSTCLQGRMDTNFHRAYHHSALQPFASGEVPAVTVARFARSTVEPVRFKRIEHDDADHSIPFFGTGSLADSDPKPLYSISRFPGIDAYLVDARSVLIPRSGQIHGVIGTAFQPIGMVLKAAVTEDAIRVTCASEEEAGYAFLALRSEWGRRQLKARAFGGSIPHLDVNNVGAVLIPRMAKEQVQRLGRALRQQRTCRQWRQSNHRRPRALNL
jgi:type I restriction enzyme S subunit